ncbi:glycolate oxidase, subunit GlcD [Polytolypa hystricis UAMH7299]|uniref:D-lactate dehydrogenase (cytochrome) n=1 Tax=Polytolypa hystricis (strain UAMH7299) TaxID=1447883 RepID=A0A2B7Z0K9_POLH7|nr:glycolate oxidase, subunit GlcD [Polytolypa hystricis UAMH7299]
MRAFGRITAQIPQRAVGQQSQQQRCLRLARPSCRCSSTSGNGSIGNVADKKPFLPSQQRAKERASGNSSSSTPLRGTGKYFLIAALAGGLGYTLGVADSLSRLHEIWSRDKKPKYGTAKDLEKAINSPQAIAELRVILGEDAISTDSEDLHLHGYSEWSTVNSERLPVAVAYPKSTAEVSQIATICHKYRMPMIPFSGGSSLEGNFSAPHGGMSIDFAHMDKIVTLHEDDMDVVVQPSVQWMQLNEDIKHSGLFFPMDPGPSARIGGMVGTNCSGTNAVRYGTMKDWVLNLTVVLSDGRVIKTRRRPRKSAAGYNLTGMFVGSEGTLGMVTEITLKLAVIPEETRVGVATFPTIRDAASAAMRVMRTGIPVQCMEVLDEVQMNVINRAGGTNRTWQEVPTLFFKFSGTKGGVAENIKATKNIAHQNKGTSFEFARNDQEAKELWSARKETLWSMMALRKEGSEVWSTDVAVPLSRLPDIIEQSKKELDDLGIFAGILGHIGDGNFHESIMYNRNDPEELAKVQKCVDDMVDRALEMEGSCTGEHGVGMGKKQSLLKEVGPETVSVMRSVKKALDPHWLLNPGKVFEATQEEEQRGSKH